VSRSSEQNVAFRAFGGGGKRFEEAPRCERGPSVDRPVPGVGVRLYEVADNISACTESESGLWARGASAGNGRTGGV